MSDYDAANDRAFRRAEAAWLTPPEDPACEACGEPTTDGGALCEECSPGDADDLASVDGSDGE